MLKSNIRKSLKKIKTKYGLIILILVVIAVFILDLKPTLMRYYSEMTLQAIGYAKEDRTSDITEYTISFNNNGGSGVMGSLTVEEGESVTLTKNTFTKTDYTFNNWNTIPNGTGTEYEDEDTISNVTQNIILYAQWT